MKHGEDIHHTDIVAPFACWRLDIPKTLHIFAGQGAILFAVAIGQCKGSHGMKLQYKIPLRCDDEFISRLNLKKDGLKYMFYQDIYRASDEQLCFRATVELVCLINGQLGNSPEYDEAFKEYI